MIPGKNQGVPGTYRLDLCGLFANRIGRTVIPIAILMGLFGRQNFHETSGEHVGIVCAMNVPVQRYGLELGQDGYLFDARVIAITHRDVDETIFSDFDTWGPEPGGNRRVCLRWLRHGRWGGKTRVEGRPEIFRGQLREGIPLRSSLHHARKVPLR